VSVSKLKDVSIEDLLGRDPVKVNIGEIVSYIKDQVVMVTGGGGSIGSEICEQVANAHPKKLIVIDIYENNAYDIQQALKRHHENLDFEVRIASIRDYDKMKVLFDEFHPDIIYHAAAHKHVPLMEESPHEAIKNNVYGTLNIVRCAHESHVKKFVMISTDKAVNPTNIMGASKRACEMIIQSYARHSQTIFTAVRFGNVLGSNGSVVPLFKQQIAEGGPVTITDKDIIRYFMTIPEAVTLVLQAGYYAKGGDIYVLDMGEPVRIDNMARNLIRLSGLLPDVDIPIVYTGLRPGEKLSEELLMDEEAYINTLDEMKEEVEHNCDHIKEKMAQLIPTYQPEV